MPLRRNAFFAVSRCGEERIIGKALEARVSFTASNSQFMLRLQSLAWPAANISGSLRRSLREQFAPLRLRKLPAGRPKIFHKSANVV